MISETTFVSRIIKVFFFVLPTEERNWAHRRTRRKFQFYATDRLDDRPDFRIKVFAGAVVFPLMRNFLDIDPIRFSPTAVFGGVFHHYVLGFRIQVLSCNVSEDCTSGGSQSVIISYDHNTKALKQIITYA